MIFVQQFLIGTFACLGYGLLCHIPKRSLIAAALVGGCSWLTYYAIFHSGQSEVTASFLAAGVVSVLADILARQLKEAATMFAIPGIIPLVPGGSLYYTILEIVNNNYDQAITTGTKTFFIAGSIAISLLVFGSFIRIVHYITRSLSKVTTLRSRY